VITPDRFRLISLIRLSLVINRGEPGVRLNPRPFRHSRACRSSPAAHARVAGARARR
jgi:hypothetical protein